MKRSTRITLLLVVAAVACIGALLLSPISQPQEYHDFADQREFWGIPNFLNVVSNIGFVLVGGWALLGLMRTPSPPPARPAPRLQDERERWTWFAVFQGTFLTGFGSAYYHWMPANETLVWDRLPMTLVTMGLLAAVISERISVRTGARWLLPLLMIGISSVFYWARSDDLRLYGVVQFLPLLLIPLLILLFAPKYTGTAGYFGALGWYILAKLAEAWDQQIFALGQLVSGHTLKHLFAAVAIYWLYRMLIRRDLVPELQPLSTENNSPRKKSRRR